MVREPKNVDFYTTGRQPSEKEFAKVSEWIKKKNARSKPRKLHVGKKKNKRN